MPTVDVFMERYAGEVPGASLLVVRDGKPLVRKSYGLANLEAHIAAAPSTNYRLASVTKQFTAASILLLAEDGKLQLDDSIREWLPTLPEIAQPMTIRHVLSHMSGLIDYEDVIPPEMTAQLHDADVLKILEAQNKTYFPPGAGYRYSNSGYALLALIVAEASGKDFASFLQQRIFTPLGMHDTVAYEQGISAVPDRAYGYSEQNGSWQRTDQSQTSAVLGDGGIYSSIDDLAKWDAALYDDRLLSARSRELAFTPVTNTDDPTIRYAMGWRVTEERVGGTTLWHSGESIGFRNVIIRYPQQRLTVILLTNRNDPEPYETARAIARVFCAMDPCRDFVESKPSDADLACLGLHDLHQERSRKAFQVALPSNAAISFIDNEASASDRGATFTRAPMSFRPIENSAGELIASTATTVSSRR